VVGAVAHEPVGTSPWPAAPTADGRDRVQQRDKLGDVVVVSAGEGDGEGCAATAGD
jgi:hypothetical protein